MKRTSSYGKDGQLLKRREVMEKAGTYVMDTHKAIKSINFT